MHNYYYKMCTRALSVGEENRLSSAVRAAAGFLPATPGQGDGGRNEEEEEEKEEEEV